MRSVQFLPLNLNDATFEQLREVGLSVTQTGRVLAHRERSGQFGSIDELEGIPGFPSEFLDQIKSRLTV
jgi:DNA uptake protein ComE-like DNA-binding protein